VRGKKVQKNKKPSFKKGKKKSERKPNEKTMLKDLVDSETL
jgi:hypothetical protein